MTSLDPRSLIAMGGFMALVMGIVLGSMRRYYPPSILGLGYWALTPVAWLITAGLFAYAGDWLDTRRLVGNGFLIGGFVLFHIGCRRFFGQATAWQVFLPAWALLMLALGWFSWAGPSYPIRAALVTTAIAGVHCATLWFLWRHGNHNFPVRMVQVTVAAHLAVLLFRLQSLFQADAVPDLMIASAVETYYLGAYVLAVLLLSIGAVLMATDRVRTELEHMATHDGLTGTLNRRAILDRCEEEHERSLRYGQPFALMMVDLDHFKAVNDTHGHQHGDRVLVHFAECARAALRRADRLGRYGGEEFLALLPGTTLEAAQPVAARIHAALQAGHPLDCQLSIGATAWRGPGDSLDAMLARADAALYQAKAQGRNQTCTA
ncbi:MAG: diguanylate cyclase [Acidovorax sp. SCN 68-22]|jgi:diguanylate cyclase (GGDEF)-like protein|nr:MAG: diguanylate cyclase [Acidovorax sp. SCN 68-22]